MDDLAVDQGTTSTATPAPDAIPRPIPRRRGWFFHPYTQILLSIVFSAAAQLFLKKGADAAVTEIWNGVAGLRSGWVWLGILGMVSSLFCWLYSLRYIPLNVAYNLAGLIQVLVPIGSWFFLGEKIGYSRGLGILLVCAGVYIVARPLMQIEEKL